MPRCIAIKKSDGQQCAFTAKPGQTLCGKHMMSNAVITTAATAIGPAAPAPAPAKLEEPISREFWVAAKNYPTLDNIQKITRQIMKIWHLHKIPSLKIPTAFMILRQKPSTDEGYMDIYNAAIELCKDAAKRFPHPHAVATAWHSSNVIQNLNEAVRTFSINGPELKKFKTDSDDPDIAHWAPIVIERHRKERAERVEAEARAAAAAEAVRRAQFEQQLREAPVVFKRDPEGGIDLRAFATDNQNIHRSSVQTATQKAVELLMTRPAPTDQETLVEITEAFTTAVTWSTPASCEAALIELTNDYFNCEAFSVPYSDVCDRVWAIIRTHEHKKDLCVRLAQEVYEGRKMCTNGKMAHLINTLQGYDEAVSEAATDTKSREVFQSKIALLQKRPNSEREAAARELFAEFEIPEAEHQVWLDALIDEEEEDAEKEVKRPITPAGGAGVPPEPAPMLHVVVQHVDNMEALLEHLLAGMMAEELT